MTYFFKFNFMTYFFLMLLLISIINSCNYRSEKNRHETEPLRVIFDTDIGEDNDDVSALAILHALADSGKVDILAMGVVSGYPYAAECLDAINTYYGRRTIPIGILKSTKSNFFYSQSNKVNYSQPVAEKFPHDIGSEAPIPDVVEVYREILANQPDGTVTMIAVGMMDNLVNLLNSKPDKISKLAGFKLVKRKVSDLYIMGPYFNKQNEYQAAYNFSTSPDAAIELMQKWPTRIKIAEGNLGHRHFIGSRLRETPAENPVRFAFEVWSELHLDSSRIARDRHCADPTAVIYAVYGSKYFNEVGPGACNVRQDDGFTCWDSLTNKQHYYNTQKISVDKLEEVMNRLLIQTPKHTY
jgi:inosine-uridine nucleoside N-ribohydrolase